MAVRVVVFGATLAGVVTLVFALMAFAPGDPIDLLPNADEVRPRLEAEWNLDKPLPARLLIYGGRVVRGDLGISLAYRPGMPVVEVALVPAVSTAGRVLGALCLTMGWGTLLAWWTAGNRSSTVRTTMQLLSIAPVFLLAHTLVFVLNEVAFAAIEAGRISRPGWFALPDQPSMLRTGLALVVLAVGSGALAEVHAQVEDVLVRVRSSAFVDAARARGAPLWPHVLLNVLPTLATITADRMAFFVGGAVILERVLSLNGAGSVLWQAALLRDYDLALGLSLLAAGSVCLARLAAEGVRLAVDPRLREQAWAA